MMGTLVVKGLIKAFQKRFSALYTLTLNELTASFIKRILPHILRLKLGTHFSHVSKFVRIKKMRI